MFKFLVLNGDQDLELSSLGYENEAITEVDLGNSKFYEAPNEILKKIASITAKQEVDIIIIRHAISGAGFEKIKAVDPLMLSRVVVIFHTVLPSKQYKVPYREMGIENFSTTTEIVPFLEDLIGKEAERQDVLETVEC